MEKPSWVCTLVTQFSLCFALYFALYMGQPQKSIYQNSHRGGSSRPLDLYFISVRGGFRPLNQQTHLLKLMEKVAKTYEVKFVVNISELGEDDPLTQTGTWSFPALRVPWYTTIASKGQGAGYFLEQINIAYGNTLDIIGVDTGSLQDLLLMGSSNGTGDNQLHWLMRKLETSDSNWRIVVGSHPLVACEEKEQMEGKHIYEPLHHIFMKYGANVYLSRQGCANYARHGSVAYIGIPVLIEKKHYLASVNGGSVFSEDMVNGFLLHRVSSLEMVTYFVTSGGEVVNKFVLQQRGKEVM